MRKITHLFPDFTPENAVDDLAGSTRRRSWQVRHIAQKHHLPENKAALIAELCGLSVRGKI